VVSVDQGVTAAAVALIDAVDFADILLVVGGDFRSLVPTAPLAVQLDMKEKQFNEGACLDAATSDAVIRCQTGPYFRRRPGIVVRASRKYRSELQKYLVVPAGIEPATFRV
jgi:hypothetical protein